MNRIFDEQELKKFLAEDLDAVGVEPDNPPRYVTARIIAEESGILCGGKWIITAFKLITPDGIKAPKAIHLLKEGERFTSGMTIAHLDIEVETLRHGIRTVLNLIQHLSGIATNTREKVEELNGLNTKLLDTRKTTPGLREFEKYAVRVGGGVNHRHNRTDGILLKKEDIIIDGGILKAIDKALGSKSHLITVEVEVETLGELDIVVADGRVNHVLLDNMSLADMTEAVRRYGNKIVFEASGIGHKSLREAAETGVQYISLSSMVRDAHPVKMKMRITEN